MAQAEVEAATAAPPLDYASWLAQGKALAAEHSNRQWLLGDWVNEGDDEYNYKNLGIESYLLIGSHPPNFWKDTSAETNLAVGTLKNLGLVARRFPPDKRIAELSWSHHDACAPYERRFEYLKACLIPGAKRHHTLAWLAAYIDKQEGDEGDPEARERRSVPLRLPLDLIEKLKDVARYRGKSMEDLVRSVCAKQVYDYVQQQEREISLELYGQHEDGRWPMDPKTKEAFQPKRKRRAA